MSKMSRMSRSLAAKQRRGKKVKRSTPIPVTRLRQLRKWAWSEADPKWASRTCQVCQKRSQTVKALGTHMQIAHPVAAAPAAPPPTNQASTMEYSQAHHIRDLEAQVELLERMRNKVITAATEAIHDLLMQLGRG